MSKKILILTAGSKGGHRSASNALKSALSKLDPSLEIVDYDANNLFLGYKGTGGEQGYITATTRLRFLWKLFFEFTSFFKGISNYFLYQAIKKKTIKLIREGNYNLIISFHPCFVGSVLKVLKKIKPIPFYVVVLDPIKHSSLWRDKKATLTFVPTEETKEIFLKKGFKETSIIKSGFPVLSESQVSKHQKNRKRLLFVNPSQRSLRFTAKLIKAAFSYDVDIDIITGSDSNLKRYLEKHLPQRDGLKIYGYVNDMNLRLKEADILLTKAGPNIMFEAVASQTPIIFTGHLPGQEEKNALYAVNRGYGFVAEKPKLLSNILKRLLVDEPELLDEMRIKEKECPDINGANNIAKIILEQLNECDY